MWRALADIGRYVPCSLANKAVAGPPPLWIEQLGSDSYDNFGTVTTNSVVAAGRIDNKDPRVVKFDAMGALV